jgi:hypothetical protein
VKAKLERLHHRCALVVEAKKAIPRKLQNYSGDECRAKEESTQPSACRNSHKLVVSFATRGVNAAYY